MAGSKNAREFLKLVHELAGKGWHVYGPIVEGEDSLMYVSFHVDPANSESLESIINEALDEDKSGFWFFTLGKTPNRFYLCSNELKSKADELGNYENAVFSLYETTDLRIKTSQKLAELTRVLKRLATKN